MAKAQQNVITATAIVDDKAQNDANTAAVKGEGQRASGSVFGRFKVDVSQDMVAKVQLIQTAKQRLAEAFDTWSAGSDKDKEAKAIADKAAVALYQARSDGKMTAEEVSVTLGDVFGFKVTKDGKVSKTPEGRGEEIRKRIVRLVNAADFVDNGDGGKYFEPVDDEAQDTVQAILAEVESGERSIWTAYEDIAELRKSYLDDKLTAWENPKAIMAIVDKLADPANGALAKLASNPALAASYDALGELLETLMRNLGETDGE